MGDPLSVVSVEDRMLVALYKTLNDEPNVVTGGSVARVNAFIPDERERLAGLGVRFGANHFFTVPPALDRPMAHRVLLTALRQRLDAMGYTVNGVTSHGYGYEFNLSINGRTVTATLYPADTAPDGDRSFLTRLEYTAEILQSPSSARVASVDLESHTQSASFRLADGGTIFLNDDYMSLTAFQLASRAYRALGQYNTEGQSEHDSPVFTGSVAVDGDGMVRASYVYPGHGDMPHVSIGETADMTDATTIRRLFRVAVNSQISF